MMLESSGPVPSPRISRNCGQVAGDADRPAPDGLLAHRIPGALAKGCPPRMQDRRVGTYGPCTGTIQPHDARPAGLSDSFSEEEAALADSCRESDPLCRVRLART